MIDGKVFSLNIIMTYLIEVYTTALQYIPRK